MSANLPWLTFLLRPRLSSHLPSTLPQCTAGPVQRFQAVWMLLHPMGAARMVAPGRTQCASAAQQQRPRSFSKALLTAGLRDFGCRLTTACLHPPILAGSEREQKQPVSSIFQFTQNQDNAKIATRRAEPLVQGSHQGENRGTPCDSTALYLHQRRSGTKRDSPYQALGVSTSDNGGASRARSSALKSEPSKKYDTRHALTVAELTNRIALSFATSSFTIVSNILSPILLAKRLTAIRATNDVSTKRNAANDSGTTVKGYPEFDSAEITSLRRNPYKRISITKKILQRKYVQIDRGVCSVSTISGATQALPSCRLESPQIWQSLSAHIIAFGMSKYGRQILRSDEVEIRVLGGQQEDIGTKIAEHKYLYLRFSEQVVFVGFSRIFEIRVAS
ncbi:hypothetical protein IWZ01DRAFT_562985 [Phyllosticta capitalensis]